MYIKKFEHFFSIWLSKFCLIKIFSQKKKLIFKNAAFNLLVKFIWKNTYTKSTGKPINGLLVHLLKKIGWRLRLHGLPFWVMRKFQVSHLKMTK